MFLIVLLESFNEENPLTIDDIVQENKILEAHPETEVEKKPSTMRIIWSKESVKLTTSIISGFVIVFLGILVQSTLAKYDLAKALGNLQNFLEFFGVSMGLGIFIFEVRKKK